MIVDFGAQDNYLHSSRVSLNREQGFYHICPVPYRYSQFLELTMPRPLRYIGLTFPQPIAGRLTPRCDFHQLSTCCS